jgi:hypothetical protein
MKKLKTFFHYWGELWGAGNLPNTTLFDVLYRKRIGPRSAWKLACLIHAPINIPDQHENEIKK